MIPPPTYSTGRFRFLNQPNDFVQFEIVRAQIRIVTAHAHLARKHRLRFACCTFFGKSISTGPAPSRLRNVEGFFHHARDIMMSVIK